MKHTYGTVFRQMRTQKGLTQRQVGKALGLTSSQFICNIEKGKAAPPLTMIPALCCLYGETPSAMTQIMWNITKADFTERAKAIKITKKLRSTMKKKIQ